MNQPSFRAELLTRRTYNRPKEDGTFETWKETVDRVIDHQQWLWERAQGEDLNSEQVTELEDLKELILDRKVSLSGRTLWLGGTETAKKYEASQFNCAFLNIETVTDVVDAYWLLLQGCGVGFKPVSGTLSGFAKVLEIDHIGGNYLRDGKGDPENKEWDYQDTHWIAVGDSAQAWAKAIGKVLAYKGTAKTLGISYKLVRPAGQRLKGYGWVSQGSEPLKNCIDKICEIMNKRAGELLTKMDILDIMNLIGTTLSSRRSAEICLMDYDDPEVYDFMVAKKDMIDKGLEHRAQSNNSIIFNKKPSRMELKGIFQTMLDSGGSEPGFINGEAARKRAPWFKGVNPCGEILLGNKSFCNLVEVDLAKFDLYEGTEVLEAVRLVSRANYRQTCVDLRDGVLSDSWHELNSYLRLCGVGLTGLQKSNLTGFRLIAIRRGSIDAAVGMADELGLPTPKAITTVKPSGTLSKIMDTTEGIHKPLGKYIFNNVNFDKDDPLVQALKEANYTVFENPFDSKNVLVTLPVCYEGVNFSTWEGKEVNLDTAVDQLESYLAMMNHYVDHNCSITVSYEPHEVDDIVEFLLDNWDDYVGVSFILRNDPTKTAEDLGYPYLPQEVVTKDTYDEYVSKLQPVTISNIVHGTELEPGSDCEGGACPVR